LADEQNGRRALSPSNSKLNADPVFLVIFAVLPSASHPAPYCNALSPEWTNVAFEASDMSAEGAYWTVRLAPSSLFASIYVLTYLRSRSALSRVSLPFLSRSLISLISIYVDPARLLCESPIPECFPDEYSSGFPWTLSNQNVCLFATVALTVSKCGPSTRAARSQNTQLFSACLKGAVFPMLMWSTKHSQVGSSTPESLRRLFEPITNTLVPVGDIKGSVSKGL